MEVQLENKIKAFYVYYINEMDKYGDYSKLNSDTLSHYCSSDLLKTIDEDKEADQDPFLLLQDINPAWLNSLNVEFYENSQGENEKKFIVIFRINNKSMMKLFVSMKYFSTVWKIYSIKDRAR